MPRNFSHIDYDDFWIENASEDELRSANYEIQSILDSMDNDDEYCCPEYNRLYDINVKIVNAISSYCAGKMPKREHGWYLPNDD